MLLPYVAVLLMVFVGWFTFFALVMFLSLPLALKAISIAWIHFDSSKEIVAAQALTIQTHLVLGLLLAAGLLTGYALN